MEYRTDVFEASSVQILVDRFERVLTAMVTDADQRLSSLDVLGADEHRRLATLGNQEMLRSHTPSTASVPELFIAQAACTPEAIAVSFGAQALTYRDLDNIANRLAHRLIGPRGDRGQLRRPGTDLPRPRQHREPTGAQADRARRATRSLCGVAVRPVC
nr:hypothetical protein [Mycolicibacterium duvalii]